MDGISNKTDDRIGKFSTDFSENITKTNVLNVDAFDTDTISPKPDSWYDKSASVAFFNICGHHQPNKP